MDDRDGIQKAQNKVRRQYQTIGGRVVKPVHNYKHGSKFQMENRLYDSIFAQRDYLRQRKETTKNLRRQQEDIALYNRAWALIRGEFMKGGFNIDNFFKNEKVVEQFLLKKHEIVMKFHLTKDNERLAYFEKSEFYDTFDNKTVPERKEEYRMEKNYYNAPSKLSWLKERRDGSLFGSKKMARLS